MNDLDIGPDSSHGDEFSETSDFHINPSAETFIGEMPAAFSKKRPSKKLGRMNLLCPFLAEKSPAQSNGDNSCQPRNCREKRSEHEKLVNIDNFLSPGHPQTCPLVLKGEMLAVVKGSQISCLHFISSSLHVWFDHEAREQASETCLGLRPKKSVSFPSIKMIGQVRYLSLGKQNVNWCDSRFLIFWKFECFKTTLFLYAVLWLCPKNYQKMLKRDSCSFLCQKTTDWCKLSSNQSKIFQRSRAKKFYDHFSRAFNYRTKIHFHFSEVWVGMCLWYGS